jgi:hypothetical protein
MAREGPIGANTAIAAATKNNEQNIRRRRDGVNVRFRILSFIGVGFVEGGIVQLRVLHFTGLYPKQKAKFPTK